MIMRRCDKASNGRRWRVLLCLLLLFMLFVLGAVLDGTLFNTAVRTKRTTSSIILRANALSWTAVESEAIYQEMQSLQDEEILHLGTDDYRESLVLLTPDGHASKFIWDYFPPSNACPMKQKLGSESRTGDHGKWVCGVQTLLQRPGCVVYSIGSGGLTAFEHEATHKTQCEVHIFDPTLSLGKQQELGRVKEFSFHNVGLTGEGIKGKAITTELFPKLDMQPLSEIMATLGHKWIDVLKVDVEGLEWPIMDSWLAAWDVLPFTQLQVELHCKQCYRWRPRDGSTAQPRPSHMLHILQQLQQRGLRVFHVEPNLWWGNEKAEYMEFAFIQVDNAGQIVSSSSAARKMSSRVRQLDRQKLVR